MGHSTYHHDSTTIRKLSRKVATPDERNDLQDTRWNIQQYSLELCEAHALDDDTGEIRGYTVWLGTVSVRAWCQETEGHTI